MLRLCWLRCPMYWMRNLTLSNGECISISFGSSEICFISFSNPRTIIREVMIMTIPTPAINPFNKEALNTLSRNPNLANPKPSNVEPLTNVMATTYSTGSRCAFSHGVIKVRLLVPQSTKSGLQVQQSFVAHFQI